MTQRVTEEQLEAIVYRINKVTGQPLTAYTKTPNGPKANVGNYHLGFQYGGVSLQQMHNEGGGVNIIFETSPKRELADKMYAFLAGMEVRIKS